MKNSFKNEELKFLVNNCLGLLLLLSLGGCITNPVTGGVSLRW